MTIILKKGRYHYCIAPISKSSVMKKPANKLLNLIALSLFSFSLYLNFIHRDQDDDFILHKTGSYAQTVSNSYNTLPISTTDTNTSSVSGN